MQQRQFLAITTYLIIVLNAYLVWKLFIVSAGGFQAGQVSTFARMKQQRKGGLYSYNPEKDVP